MATSSGNVSSEQIHVVLVDTATMIGDASRDVCCVACRLNLPPAIIALEGTTTGRGELIRFNLLQALQIELIERIKTPLADVQSTEDK